MTTLWRLWCLLTGRPTGFLSDGCQLHRVGEMEPDGARWVRCATCGITGRAYAFPDPRSQVRCFRREIWHDDKPA
jgi:hypothetical protein